jgi:hypothetical protein
VTRLACTFYGGLIDVQGTRIIIILLQTGTVDGKYTPVLDLDGANGVGALKIPILQSHIGSLLTINLFNKGDGPLNKMVRAHSLFISYDFLVS